MQIGNIETNIELFKPQHKDKNGSFNSLFKDALGTVTELHKEADNAIKELANGDDITSAIVAMEKADMSFQVMIEVRNKFLNAYEEIMRMQI
jgi:flagellar hook-basal body complex protein FliE